MGTGLNCTKPKFHEAKFEWGYKIAQRRFCTQGELCTRVKKKVTDPG